MGNFRPLSYNVYIRASPPPSLAGRGPPQDVDWQPLLPGSLGAVPAASPAPLLRPHHYFPLAASAAAFFAALLAAAKARMSASRSSRSWNALLDLRPSRTKPIMPRMLFLAPARKELGAGGAQRASLAQCMRGHRHAWAEAEGQDQQLPCMGTGSVRPWMQAAIMHEFELVWLGRFRVCLTVHGASTPE